MAAETIIKLFLLVYAKRRGLFVMERTPSPKIAAPFFQMNVSADDVRYISFKF